MKTGKLSLKAILFDFDGTLARLNIDFTLMRRVVLELIGGYGVPQDGLADLFVLEMIEAGGKRLAETNPEDLPAYRNKAYSLIEAIEMDAARQGDLIEGIRPMLAELQRSLIGTGVVSRNSRGPPRTRQRSGDRRTSRRCAGGVEWERRDACDFLRRRGA